MAKVKLLRGISGEWKGQPFQHPPGSEVDIDDARAKDWIRAGNAVAVSELVNIPTPEAVAITPMVEVQRTAVVKRQRRKK